MRNRMFVVFVVFAAFVLVFAQLGAFQTDEPREVPLNAVYASFSQEGVKPLDSSVEGEELNRISSLLQEAPLIVLCVGDDIAAAEKASTESFAMPLDSACVSGAPTDILWAAAYLGSDGSVPPAYQVRAVEVRGKTIRICYERDQSPVRSCDLRSYLVWVPLGLVEPGAYTLELFDVGTREVTQSRPWQVTVK